ncbi:MAG: BA14K family protein [Alphaproteobacteria bacterium]|uniref:BA14K family protein n=1 Tax=Bradyrhizobium sp. TaxID=376 RepID=UPI001D93C55D|nr:BA14K family protein [Bradyrhizobium sp.]MBV9062777.1 BA14K family protein [Alphaproteobacteria bacterium]MBV9560028.1 BA14K family protein [Bradyrhizobium sp.]
MTGFKTVVAAALVSLAGASAANAQLPEWAASHPGAFQSQYPDRDVLNGGALTPAGRMGLERPGGAAPVFGLDSVYRAEGAVASSRLPRHRSYEPGSHAFRGHDVRSHFRE